MLAAFGEESLLRIPQPGTDRPRPHAASGGAADPAATSVRSLNLATAVAIAGYEGYRQL